MSSSLPDIVGPSLAILFVGINPGLRSALTGHHFAGHSNRFWKLLFDAELVPQPIGYAGDRMLPRWGMGITNLVPRPTAGIDTLRRDEYVAGLRTLRQKVRRWRPAIVALVGVTVYRAVREGPRTAPVELGLQRDLFEGARVFVLPNPSGRNANYSYDQMLAAYRQLAAAVGTVRSRGGGNGVSDV